MTVTPEELMAYADGELTGDDKARVEAAIAGDSALRAEVERHRRMRGLLQKAYGGVIDEPMPAHLTQAARGTAPEAAEAPIDLAAARAKRIAAPVLREWRGREWGAMAAALIVGVLVGGQTLNRGGLIGDDLVAQGALSRALETQLAADEGRQIRIGVSFVNATGAPCRTFAADRGALQGLACKDAGAWRIDTALRGEQQSATEFRMAAVETPAALLARVEDLANDQGTLDAAAERAARDGGWKAPSPR